MLCVAPRNALSSNPERERTNQQWQGMILVSKLKVAVVNCSNCTWNVEMVTSEVSFVVVAVQFIINLQVHPLPRLFTLAETLFASEQAFYVHMSPAEFGLACHLGVLSGLPCIGVAKNLLHVQGVVRDKEHLSQVRITHMVFFKLEWLVWLKKHTKQNRESVIFYKSKNTLVAGRAT